MATTNKEKAQVKITLDQQLKYESREIKKLTKQYVANRLRLLEHYSRAICWEQLNADCLCPLNEHTYDYDLAVCLEQANLAQRLNELFAMKASSERRLKELAETGR